MSLDEKAKIDEISPIPSHSSGQAPAATEYSTPSLSALDNLQVLPKIFQEGVLFVASGPALLLQAAQPGINSKNNSSSNSTSSNLTSELPATLHATLSYLACLVFGTREEKAALIGRLRLGQPPGLPSQGRANHPPSQLWLAATLYVTATDFYQRVYGTFDFRTSEAAYIEFGLVLRHLAPTVFPQGAWPSSRTEFWKYWDDQIDNLVVSAEAQNFATDLTQRTDLPRGVGFTKPVLRAITVEMLPVRIRDAYGLKSTVGTRRLYSTSLGFLKPVYPLLPRGWKSHPVQYYLEELRKQINA
ncbi:hypothetical protein BDW62DRAFT_207554 [Aspergillus aurantiobrunneus]